MPDTEYGYALKQARKRYQDALAKGEYPYLPVLDNILADTDIVSTVSLGIMDIPLAKLVGTKTAERSSSFASNFMPLLPERSEFGSKWAALYKYQVHEGIQDPIVAYEFMNQFYVQEGNKRVSVMKYLGAYSIPGNVTRLIPKRTDDKENRLYYEFLDFYRVSLNCDVWFSKEGSYQKLLEQMGMEPDQVWTEEERLFFRSSYGRFAKAYSMAHGEQLQLTEGDAFLVYMEIYGYDSVKGQTEREMYRALMRIWEEIQLANRGRKVELIETPQEMETDHKPSLWKWFLPAEDMPEHLKIGFIYADTVENSSWNYGHELGRLYLEQAFEGRVSTTVIEGADTEEDIAAAIEKLVDCGCTMIFTTNSKMVNQSVRSAIGHPEVKIYNCSINMSYSSICTYYARMYEAKFLMGAIAAAVSREFAMGARMINPYVKVYLEWRRVRQARTATERLREKGVRYISGKDMIIPRHPSREYGLYVLEKNGEVTNLASPIWNWGKFYEQMIQLAFESNEELEARKGKKAVNYWWGMSADVIDVICSGNLPHGTLRLIEFLKNSVRSGSFHPFDGLIYAQDGSVKCREGEKLRSEDIVTMNWLAENVEGSVPELEELNDEARERMQLQGIRVDETAQTEKK